MTNSIVTASVLTIAAIMSAAALSYSRSILVPFVLAVFLFYITTPFVNWFEKRLKVPRSIALLLSLLLTFTGMVGIGIFIVNNFRELLESADLYRAKILSLVDPITYYGAKWGFRMDEEGLKEAASRILSFQSIGDFAGRFLGVFSSGVLVLIFLGFLVTGARSTESKGGIYAEIDAMIRKYLLTKLITSTVTAVLIGAFFMIIGIEMAFMFAVLAFWLNFIPTLGSIIATLLPVPIAFVQYENPIYWILCLAIPGSIQFVIGNIIEPKMLGQGLDLHPAAILLSLMFWGLIWGLVGMLLAVPLMVVLKIIMARFPTTRPVSELLAGRLPNFS